MQSVRLAAPIQFDSSVDGKGLRMVLWTQGCRHHCRNCHNPETWNMSGGKEYSLDEIFKTLEKGFYHTGLTLSGGDPLEQALELIPVVKKARSLGLDIWCYTGYRYEDIIGTEKFELVKLCDVLVDGPFIDEKKSMSVPFRGSSNQRLIDVKKSIEKHGVVELRI